MAIDSQVLTTVLQLCRNFDPVTPEAVIFGYAKLLLMDETQIRNLITDEDMGDLDAARRWFSDKKMDLKLIKSGLMILSPLIIRDDERKADLEEFRNYLDRDGKVSSPDILDKALSLSAIDFRKVFADGREMTHIFNVQEDMKEASKKYAEAHADEKAAEEEKKAKDEKAPRPQKQEGAPAESEEEKHTEESGKRSYKKESDAGEKDEKKETSEGRSENNDEIPDLEKLSERYRALNSALLDVVKGQDHAVLKFVQGINQGELLKHAERGKRPRSYFFFFGPPGVGKTLLAETAAEALGMPFKIFNMSEYSSHQSHEELIGISKIYNTAKEGSLVKYVRENPECLLVFDEIEKAHINVIRLFLQILGAGKLNNVYRDEDVSFSDVTIIFTSNVGRELYADRSVNLTTLPEKVLIDSIAKEKDPSGEPALPPEICSRIASGNTIMFNHLSIRHLTDMVNTNFERIVTDMESEYGIRITYSNFLPLMFLYNRGGDIDARVATGQSGKFLKNEIFELLRQMQKNTGGEKITSINIDVDWDGIDPELMHLFRNEESADILFFTSEEYDVSEALSSDQYHVHRAATIEDARELVQGDLAVAYIDPFFGKNANSETVLSISDYNTDGVRLFHELAENQSGLPIYLLETDHSLSDVDKQTFIQEGAVGTVDLKPARIESFRRMFEQTLEELYMEKESQAFTQRGWIVDFNTKQEISGSDVKITIYNIRKRMAVDVESRGSILSDAERPNVRFGDVIGAENAKEELAYFVKYLTNPKKFLMNGGKPPKGVLLYGPPGTGKTMLAKAMAGESDVTFLQTSAAEFKNKYVGVSEENIRKLFARARKYAPAIIFIDEIDAIGKKRTGSEFTSGNESMLNTLLTEMDGFSGSDPNKPVFVLAATNFGVGAESDGISSLDDALIRRFDNKIYVDLPKESERKLYILRVLENKGVTTVSENTAQSIAERTTGQSLAVLQNVIDLAFRAATRAERAMTDDDLLSALEEYNYGEKKEHTPEYYRRVAIHETGHAFLSYISGDKPSYITIESRGNFGGYMQHANQEETPSYTKEELLARIRTSLAGRAAEQVFYGKDVALNTGASSDLEQATNVAFRIISTYGMDENSLIVLGRKEILSSALADDYVAKVNRILADQMAETIRIIEENKDRIKKIADVLVKENRLTGKEFESLMETGELPPEGAAAEGESRKTQ
ncbi:MAG: AAA family ATPase [Lachnospiraceae bacterium]|nr:AAA family ATPase [Lachnospiraceae bacterium]